ncbi:MAG: hybrid sensor histidine kinase/response regulator [Proteobacteria bacterium]|nr:hybrid sensor histidine kinase/response regulator [Pseudomonadota bacterium]
MGESVRTDTAATILVVDDTPANVGILVDYLEGHGFRVLVAQDGEEGLARAGFAHPDLILLDVMMPGIDGFEVCRQLKKNADTREIPVICMTALSDVGHKLIGFESGASDYVTKPFDMAEVLARINNHLALRAMQAQLEEQNFQLRREMAERLQSENELRQVFGQLKTLDRMLAETQSQLLQSEKMASVGVLAAGVAHEINNPLGFINSNLGCLKSYTADLLDLVASYESLCAGLPDKQIADLKARADLEVLKRDISGLIDESLAGVARVTGIVQNLRHFSHVGESAWQFANINLELESALGLVAGDLEQGIAVIKDYGTLPGIECSPSELNQVFLNLLRNAIQAIVGDGEIRIRTGVEGDEIWIEIADTGVGIEPQNLDRIFDPFFTTRSVGMGMGLGLSLSYASIKNHHGRIEVQSEVGKGSVFRIFLPTRQTSRNDQPPPEYSI